jgi:hypothetical protein
MKKLSKINHTIYFHDWLEICKSQLCDAENTKDWMWELDFNEGIINDVNTTDIFKKYYLKVQERESVMNEKWRLLCVDVFLNDYLQHKSRRKTVTGVYVHIINKVLLIIAEIF